MAMVPVSPNPGNAGSKNLEMIQDCYAIYWRIE
jgi:hypothetical protein